MVRHGGRDTLSFNPRGVRAHLRLDDTGRRLRGGRRGGRSRRRRRRLLLLLRSLSRRHCRAGRVRVVVADAAPLQLAHCRMMCGPYEQHRRGVWGGGGEGERAGKRTIGPVYNKQGLGGRKPKTSRAGARSKRNRWARTAERRGTAGRGPRCRLLN